MSLPNKLWSGEPFLRIAIEAAVFLLSVFVLIATYSRGIEPVWSLRLVFFTAGVLVGDWLGFAAYFFWNGCR